MLAVDTSALVAIALEEPEADAFSRTLAGERAIIGTPTLLELRVVLSSRLAAPAAFVDEIMASGGLLPFAFDLAMYEAAAAAFRRYGRARHAAGQNFGDCLSYSVAKTQNLPLLYKGAAFALTDIRPALA